jgi:hypothetical protein
MGAGPAFRGGQHFRTHGGMNGEIDPQDLFNMFFGGGMGPGEWAWRGVHANCRSRSAHRLRRRRHDVLLRRAGRRTSVHGRRRTAASRCRRRTRAAGGRLVAAAAAAAAADPRPLLAHLLPALAARHARPVLHLGAVGRTHGAALHAAPRRQLPREPGAVGEAPVRRAVQGRLARRAQELRGARREWLQEPAVCVVRAQPRAPAAAHPQHARLPGHRRECAGAAGRRGQS